MTRLRTLFSTSHENDKSYFLTAAPQCPRPDQSIPIAAMIHNLDLIMPQFYNNPSCNLGTDGFIPSLSAWLNDIATLTNPDNPGNKAWVDVGNGMTGPRLLIGAPADAAAAGAGGFVDVQTFKTLLADVKSRDVGGAMSGGVLGGVMYWDGAYLELAKQRNAGRGYAEAVRQVWGTS